MENGNFFFKLCLNSCVEVRSTLRMNKIWLHRIHYVFHVHFAFPQGRCDINIRNNRNQTPLQLAVTQGHTELVQLLVAEGADVNMEDEDGDTAMHVALLRPQLANVMLSPTVATSSAEDVTEGCSMSLYCRVSSTATFIFSHLVPYFSFFGGA